MNHSTHPSHDKDSKSTSPMLLATPIALLAAYLLWNDAISTSNSAIKAPPLYKSVQHCAEHGNPLFYADSARSRAQIKMARYAFYPADGPRALVLLSEAERCFSTAGKSEEATEVAAVRESFEDRVTADYRGHRLRLSQALARERQQDAVREARALTRLLEDQGKHSYVRWLNRIVRSAS